MNPKINHTTDYRRFKFMHDRNRKIYQHHVQQFIKSFIKVGYIPVMPIVVSSKYEILDGQHRLTAIKTLAEQHDKIIPFTYVINDEFSTDVLPVVNSVQKKWNNKDYLHHYIHMKNDNYRKLFRFMTQNSIEDVSSALAILNIDPTLKVGPVFYEGQFVYPKDDKHAKRIVEMINDFNPYVKDCRSTKFVSAVVCLYIDEVHYGDYVHERMIKRLSKSKSLRLEHTMSVKGYFAFFNQAYHYGDSRAPYLVRRRMPVVPVVVEKTEETA